MKQTFKQDYENVLNIGGISMTLNTVSRLYFLSKFLELFIVYKRSDLTNLQHKFVVYRILSIRNRSFSVTFGQGSPAEVRLFCWFFCASSWTLKVFSDVLDTYPFV